MCASGDDVDRFGERAEEVCAVRCGVASASVSVGVGEKQKRAKRDAPSSSGLAKEIMSSGRISGTPPTRVETT